MSNPQQKKGLWSKPSKKWLLGIPLGGILAFILGAFALGGFHYGMTYTNNNDFCYGCHVGMDTIVEEYEASPHFTNTKGVVAATCSDCHVPQEFFPKMALKIGASVDIIHMITGKINLENFESEHRPRLAEKVTHEFKENDSKQCRYCHDVTQMDFENQSRNASRRHQTMEARGLTCIDCHAGIAHKLPE
ncbi:NapC/NirT family cytochrome c (plasmid) [Photobacterium sp. DA100]|uniref:NapC/NirT family cytochrome c n=1 Tax=Photobacterium sp. DA100 TaxID=3027472 RepID=UPI00247AB422|nr:NapC/NirT family cytochrome c [Photobacterium sp. DA100]WEM44443.1 NapC/NirT family cytochrome c [Photobacterium sp. DA100]